MHIEDYLHEAPPGVISPSHCGRQRLMSTASLLGGKRAYFLYDTLLERFCAQHFLDPFCDGLHEYHC